MFACNLQVKCNRVYWIDSRYSRRHRVVWLSTRWVHLICLVIVFTESPLHIPVGTFRFQHVSPLLSLKHLLSPALVLKTLLCMIVFSEIFWNKLFAQRNRMGYYVSLGLKLTACKKKKKRKERNWRIRSEILEMKTYFFISLANNHYFYRIIIFF